MKHAARSPELARERVAAAPAGPEGRLWIFIAVLALSLATVLIAWSAREPGSTTGNDDARYMLLARAIRAGTYRDLYRVGQGWHALYPPGYPAFLALFGAVMGEGYDRFVALNILLTLATLALVFDAARRLWSVQAALAAFALGAFNYNILEHSTTWVMSEALYTALTALALWAVVIERGSARWIFVAGAAACAAALTRSVGVTMVGALGLAWVLERRWKAVAGLAAGAAVTVGPWLAWMVRAPTQYLGRSYAADATESLGGSAVSFVGGILRRVGNNGTEYGMHVIPGALSVTAIEGTPIDNVLWFLLWSGLALVGFVSIWRRWRALALYAVCYLGLLLVWTWPQTRFFAPIMPFLVLALAVGAWQVGRRFGRARTWAPVAAVAVVLSVTGLAAQLRRVRETLPCDRSSDPPTLDCKLPVQASFVAAARFARDSLPAGASIVAGKDASFAFLSGHPVVPAAALVGYPPEALSERAREVGADYLFVGRVHFEDVALAKAILPICDRLVLVKAFEPHSFLIRLPSEGTSAGNGGALCGPLQETVEPGALFTDDR